MEYNDATQIIDDESEEDDGDAEQCWAVIEMRDGGEEQSHPLFVDPGRTEDRFWIGRDASCEVTLDAASVSRRHAELVVRRTGVGEYITFVLLDASARNGVKVDGRKILAKTLTRVRFGQSLLIGNVRIRIVGPGSTPVAEEAPAVNAAATQAPLACCRSTAPPRQHATHAQARAPQVVEEEEEEAAVNEDASGDAAATQAAAGTAGSGGGSGGGPPATEAAEEAEAFTQQVNITQQVSGAPVCSEQLSQPAEAGAGADGAAAAAVAPELDAPTQAVLPAAGAAEAGEGAAEAAEAGEEAAEAAEAGMDDATQDGAEPCAEGAEEEERDEEERSGASPVAAAAAGGGRRADPEARSRRE